MEKSKREKERRVTKRGKEIYDKISTYIWKHTSRVAFGGMEVVKPAEVENDLNKIEHFNVSHRMVLKYIGKLEEDKKIMRDVIEGKKGYRWVDSKPPAPLIFNLPDEVKTMIEGVAEGDFISYVCLPAIEHEHPEKITLRNGEEAFKKRIGATFYYAKPSINEKLISVMSPVERDFIHTDPFWLQHIFRYALREKLMDRKYFDRKSLENISSDELNKMWENIFGETNLLLTIFTFDPEKLLDFLKTDIGKAYLRQALPDEVRESLLHEATELWKQREEMDKKFKSLDRSKS